MHGGRKVWLLRRAVVVAVAVVITLAAAAGLAYATIPDNGKVFTACMLKSVGTVRLIDSYLPSTNPMSHCTSLETQVTWNQQGQQGPQGPQGAAGASGTGGHVYSAYTPTGGTQHGANQTIVSVAVPEGSYAVSGKAEMFGYQITNHARTATPIPIAKRRASRAASTCPAR